jgi:hypothetical protein
MITKYLGLLLILLMALPIAAAPPPDKVANSPAIPKIASIDNTTFINANKILMFVTNHASWGRDLNGYFGNDYGTYYPYSDTALISSDVETRSPYYAGGLWVGAIDSASGDTLVTISEYDDEYAPGPMANETYQTDIPEFRVYKLYGDSQAVNPNQDYLDYIQYAIPQGAPFKMTGDGGIIPDMKGDQMLWSVCNDADPNRHTLNAGSQPPLGIEIKNTTYAYNTQNPLNEVIFIKLQIYNKGHKTLQNCLFSVWSDPDLGGSDDDLVGCDTVRDLGYVYNATNSDKYYGSEPPCLGMDLLQSPMIYTGNMADTGKMWNTVFTGYKNVPLYSFNKYINGTDPDDHNEAYNYMQGLNRDGSPYIFDGDTIKFVCSGDPVAGTGELDHNPNDRRFMLTTGPITFRPGDSTEIMAAIIIGQDSDRLRSISTMKSNDKFAQMIYDIPFMVLTAPIITGPSSVCADGYGYYIEWANVYGATSFEISDNGGDWTDIGYSCWTDDSFPCRQLYFTPSAGSYCHRVRAKNFMGVSNPSNQICVTVNPVPEIITLIEPIDGAKIDTLQTLYWQAPIGATKYHLIVDDEPYFDAPIWINDSSLHQPQYEFQGLPPNVTLYWRVRARISCGWGDWSDTWQFSLNPTSVHEIEPDVLPVSFALNQNYPNPFNPATTIEFAIPEKSYVTVSVYNLLGVEITKLVQRELSAGRYQMVWDGRGADGQMVATGIYLYKIQAGDFTETRKMLLLK